jgi:hypothetical protein
VQEARRRPALESDHVGKPLDAALRMPVDEVRKARPEVHRTGLVQSALCSNVANVHGCTPATAVSTASRAIVLGAAAQRLQWGSSLGIRRRFILTGATAEQRRGGRPPVRTALGFGGEVWSVVAVDRAGRIDGVRGATARRWRR